MSKINQIQEALKEIEGGEFQKLADSYIHKKGYNNINPIGSVTGANKVSKGTPDTFVRQENGKLIFAEYTTEQKNLSGKLKGDFGKCLDVSKTGVPLNEIEEIVFCHNSLLSPEDEQELYIEGEKHGIKIKVIGIGSISFDLYQKYPSLAQDFLGISIDTGQILEPDDFVANVGRNQLTTPLDTDFHFREQEIQQISEELENSNLVIVSGQAGIGKSRLALQALQNFKDVHPNIETRCIYNRGPDLFEDIRTHFSQPGNFLILVDDANRITQFDYVIDLIQNQRLDQKIKVIATVRDYARNKINQAAKSLGTTSEIKLEPMEAQEIKDLVKDQYSITNLLFLERITEISGGNPRLAIMAAKVAVEHDNLNSIGDVSALYDTYFSSLSNDLKDLKNENILKVAGVISFFRTIDRSNIEMMQLIQNAFGITPDNFWTTAQQLHDCEVVDIYEREIVKISDQVFATYLFYLCFFKDRILNFKMLIDNFFPGKTNCLRDAIYPCLNVFNFKELTAQMRPHIQNKWHDLIRSEDTSNLHTLIQLFWFLLQSDALLYIRNCIEATNSEPIELTSIEWTTGNTDTNLHPLLELLGLFKEADEEGAFRSALELACKYVEKIPQAVPQFLHLLTQKFGFTRRSHLRGYSVQKIVIDTLWQKANQDQNELFSRLFLAVGKKYLHTKFDSHESSENSVTIYKFDLLAIEPVFELREVIWNGVFQLHQTPSLQKESLSVLRSYSNSGYYLSQKEIVIKDEKLIVSFVKNSLDPDNFTHCLTIQDYLAMTDRRDILDADGLSEKFRSEIYEIYELLSFDYSDVGDMEIHEFEEFKRQKIRGYTDKFDLKNYLRLIQQSIEILSHISDDYKIYQFKTGILQVIVALAERDADLFAQVLQEYLKLGNPLKIQHPTIIVDKLLKTCGAEKSLKIIKEPEYQPKPQWLFAYYQFLPSEDITSESIENLYELYRNAEPSELPFDYDHLLNYTEQDDCVVMNITNIIVDKLETDGNLGNGLFSLFSPLSEVNKQIFDLFKDHQNSLERAYITHIQGDRNADYNGAMFSRILSVNPDFILNYIDHIYGGNERIYTYANTRDYSFLWTHAKCGSIMLDAIERILHHEKKQEYISGSFLEQLFCAQKHSVCPPEVVAKQDKFLTAIIQEQAENSDLMVLLFRPISTFTPERRKYFIELFLNNNKSYEDFEKLGLESNHWSWEGSAVQMHQNRVEYWESLLPLCNSAELLQHRLSIEKQVQTNRNRVEAAKKSDFIEDRF